MQCEISGNLMEQKISGVTADSRKVEPDMIFVAVRGVRADGHSFISQAINNGAGALVVDRKYKSDQMLNVPTIQVDDTAEALVILLSAFLGNPPKKLYAVTGTNGKTTVTYMLWNIFTSAGEKAGLIGTLGYMFENGEVGKLPVTTPAAESLWKLFAEMNNRGITSVALEASSHGIHQKRVWGLNFKAVVFTNLSQDHLDYHKTMESYFDAKCQLFRQASENSTAVINIDDPAGADIVAVCPGDVITYSMKNPGADIFAKSIQMDFGGSTFSLATPWGKFEVRVNIPGKFNIYNATAAAGATLSTGYSTEDVLRGLANFDGIKGRFQRISMGQPFQVIVDYAHTPQALHNLIATARKLTTGKVIVVFGAGGDRDIEKRPIMGNVATKYADIAVITSDNPRSENPDDIIDMIVEGISSDNFIRITDRKDAIFEAIKIAQPGDTVIIAGKGHEDYQIFANCTIHFDDVEVAREAIENLKKIEL